jgi:hypothetical protein
MDKVQPAQRNEYPYSTELDSIPRELLEMICYFMNAEDIAHLSGVNHSLNMSLSQRAVEIGKAGIGKALSDGRADQAFSMLGSFCKWLSSANLQLPLNEKLRIWECLQDFAGHASFNVDQQSLAFRQIYFSACQTTDPVTDEVLQIALNTYEKWLRKCSPTGLVFNTAGNLNTYYSFNYLSQYLERSQSQGNVEVDLGRASSPPKSAALLGACIQAIHLHEDLADCSKLFTVVALKLKNESKEIPMIFRQVLILDLITCASKFPEDYDFDYLPLIDPFMKNM